MMKAIAIGVDKRHSGQQHSNLIRHVVTAISLAALILSSSLNAVPLDPILPPLTPTDGGGRDSGDGDSGGGDGGSDNGVGIDPIVPAYWESAYHDYGMQLPSSGCAWVGDINGDAVSDYFCRTSIEQYILNKYDTYPGTHLFYDRVGYAGFAFGDFNGDGQTDMFKYTSDYSNGTWNHIAYVSWGGEADWEYMDSYGNVPITSLRFGDFNGDGITDVFTTSITSGQWSVKWGGSGTWQRLKYSNISVTALRFADVDGDGATDVVRRYGNGYKVAYHGQSDRTYMSHVNPRSIKFGALGRR